MKKVSSSLRPRKLPCVAMLFRRLTLRLLKGYYKESFSSLILIFRFLFLKDMLLNLNKNNKTSVTVIFELS